MRLARGLLIALIALAAVAGCGRDDAATSNGRVSVAAAIYPLAFVAERVGADRVTTSSLARAGVEPHDLELSPKQAAQLEDVDLVLFEQGFQPALDDAVSRGNSFDVTSVEPLVDGDPHIWLDPVRLGRIVTAVASRLAEIDPDGADVYASAADRLVADLTELDGAFRSGLKTCRLRQFVTSHDAFGYLARRYGLSQVGISGLDPEADPSPARLREVAAFVRAKKVGTIFVEPLVSPKVARTIARETGATTAVLDPVESVAAGSGDDYLVVMRRNLDALRSALGCS